MIVTKPIILDKLRAELQTAGITVAGLVLSERDNQKDLRAVNAQGRWEEPPSGAAAVIDAHDGTPPEPPDYGTDAEDLSDAAALRTAVQNLRTYIGLASPTAAQSATALKLVIRVVLAMLRRML